MQTETTSGARRRSETREPSLQRQARRLVTALDAIVRRLTASRPQLPDETARLSVQDARAFVVLAQLGAATMTEFARALGVPLSTATHSINRLVTQDLVTREHSEADRRVVNVRLSDRGLRMADEHLRRRLANASILLASLAARERQTFLELVDTMAGAGGPADRE